jgi:hypothetical protein
MRKAIAVAVIGLAASLASAATVKLQPLNVKPGLWQDTVATKYTGLPPQMAAALNSKLTFKTCLKGSLDANAWAADLARVKCSSLTVLKSTGTDLEVQGKGCDAGNGITANGLVKFHVLDSEHVAGTADATASGNTPFGGSGSLHADYSDKWLGATCPADMK